MMQKEQWQGFEGRLWKEEINTRDFIQKNYKPYDGDASFLAGPTEATDKLWGILQGLQKNVQKAAFWIWKQKWYLLLPLTVQVISAKN
mgnify:CR=1 FL=1